jgi:hypothetical protein
MPDAEASMIDTGAPPSVSPLEARTLGWRKIWWA